MNDQVDAVEDLTHEDTARLVLDMFHRIVMHYGIWFNEIKHQMGMEKALDTLERVSKISFGIQMKRLSKILDFEIEDDIPEFMMKLPQETLLKLLDGVAVNWIANDGVWFQALEFSDGMIDAKRCNDSAWAQFSPFEARSIKTFLNFPENPGIEGLKKALKFRLYARINTQTLIEESDGSLVMQMNECRVQSARKRKGLDDYPCKSGGTVEYTYFARSIDSRIITECIGCPPDDHPDEWYCSWRFKIG
jgi:hypothetical protein